MQMQLVDVIEECSLCQVPDEVIWEITRIYTPKQIDQLIQIFLRGIGSRHQVPGRVISTLQGISGDYQEQENMTKEQQTYAIGRIIVNWHSMSCESRAGLAL
jgi:hypothetical protein